MSPAAIAARSMRPPSHPPIAPIATTPSLSAKRGRISITGGVRSALVADPDGEWVQLVVAPNASKETYGRLEIGIAANLGPVEAAYRALFGSRVQRQDDTLTVAAGAATLRFLGPLAER